MSVRSMRTRFSASRIKLILASLLLGAGVQVSPAAACATSERSVFFVEFDDGISALEGATAERFRAQLLPFLTAPKYVDSYYVLASGDVGEGADWNAASERARSDDLALGRARSVAIRAMLDAQPKQLRSKSIEVKIRDSRQVLTEAEMQANPRLNARVRAAIVADIRTRADRPRKGRPVPVC